MIGNSEARSTLQDMSSTYETVAGESRFSNQPAFRRNHREAGVALQSRRRQTGFSLIEIMVTMTLLAVLLGSVYYLMQKNQDIFVVEAARVDLHQNLRVAVEVFSRDIQAAGSGLPQFLGPISGRDGGTDAGGAPVTDAAGRPLTDQMLLIYGDPDFPALTVKNTPASFSTPVEVYDPVPGPSPVFTDGEFYLLYAVAQPNTQGTPDMAQSAIFTLQSHARNAANNGSVLNCAAPITTIPVPNWQNGFPSSASLRVARIDRWMIYRVDPTKNELQQSINGADWRLIARHITDLQCWYRTENVSASGAGWTPVHQTLNEPGTGTTDNRTLIRAVGFQIRAETDLARVPDALGQRAITQDVIVAPRNLTLPGFVINR